MTPNPSIPSIEEFARLVLYGTSLDEKLAPFDLGTPSLAESATPLSRPKPFTAPNFPGRPTQLQRLGNTPFPKITALHADSARAQILHFFANHELLAMELMALVLLKFPEAPPAFRLSLAQTISEEQNHMRLYIERMQELGMSFGDLPVTDYFWNALKEVESPLLFVTQMSLTFEQANLDYSLYYRNAVLKHGDEKTAVILERVYQEEIGHVKNGLIWFNRWRDQSAAESDWKAYLRMLPPPLTARRAKGIEFDRSSRKSAGFSEEFIENLEIDAGSRGRPPVLWIYNSSCEAENARGRPGFSTSQIAKAVSADLAPLLTYLAKDSDLILLDRKPSPAWVRKISELGFKVPQFALSSDLENIRDPKLSDVEPWGWSPEIWAKLLPLAERIVPTEEGKSSWSKALLSKRDFSETGLTQFFSKSWSTDFLGKWMLANPGLCRNFGERSWVGKTCSTSESAVHAIREILRDNAAAMLKAPFGTAGNQVRQIRSPEELTTAMLGWIANTIGSQKEIIVEPKLDKIHDLSMQIEIGDRISVFEAREFLVDSSFQYQGSFLGKKAMRFSPEVRRFFMGALPAWRKLAMDVALRLSAEGYRGNLGIDAMICRTSTSISDGTSNGIGGEGLALKPIVEINPRWTMGRIALALEDYIVPGNVALLRILKKKKFDSQTLKVIEEKFPLIFCERIESGILWTTEPESSTEVVTALGVGPEALECLLQI